MPHNCPADCQHCRSKGVSHAHPAHLSTTNLSEYHHQPAYREDHFPYGERHAAAERGGLDPRDHAAGPSTSMVNPEQASLASRPVPEPADGECKIGHGHHFPHHHHHHHTHNEPGEAAFAPASVPAPPHEQQHHGLPLRSQMPMHAQPVAEQHHHHDHEEREHRHDYLDDRVRSKKGAESAVIHLTKKHGLDLDGVRAKALERDLEHIATSLSYSMMAQRVHLDPHAMVGDAPTFQVHRARIMSADFRMIVQDFETLANQYGPPADHLSEAGRSRYISAAFNNIVAWFRLMIYNRPENYVEASNPTKHGLRNYFKCFGGCTILVLDIRLNLGIGKDRLTYIAQLIADLESCNLSNEKQGFSVPIMGILCDGSSFEFFSYDGFSKSFSRGLLVSKSAPGATAIARVTLPQITQATGVEYIRALRPLCESFYFLLLKGFLAGLEAYIRRARDYGAGDGTRHYGSEGEWELALAKAVFARNKAVEAGEVAMEGQVTRADRLAQEAKSLLEESISSIPSGYQRRVTLMTSFDVADTSTA